MIVTNRNSLRFGLCTTKSLPRYRFNARWIALVCAKLGLEFSSRETGAMKSPRNVVGNRESMIDRRGRARVIVSWKERGARIDLVRARASQLLPRYYAIWIWILFYNLFSWIIVSGMEVRVDCMPRAETRATRTPPPTESTLSVSRFYTHAYILA